MSSLSSDYQKILEDYEERIIKFYVKSGRAKNFTDTFSTIFATFYTRRKLTQKQLQELTGFSTGTISRIINQLLLMNMIQAYKQPGTREKIYEIKGFGPDFVESASKLIERYVNNYKRLLKKVQRRITKINHEVNHLKENMDFEDLYLLGPISEKILTFQAFITNFTLVYITLKNAATTIEEEMSKIANQRRN